MLRTIVSLNLAFLFIVLSACEEKKKYWLFLKGEVDTRPVQLLLKDNRLDFEYYSEWLRAGTLYLTNDQRKSLSDSRYFDAIILASNDLKFNQNYVSGSSESSLLGFGLKQINAQAFLDEGLTGEGVKIGVIDGGFLETDTRASLSHIYDNNLVKGYRDFVTPFLTPYSGSKGLDDVHGTDVLSNIGGVKVRTGIQLGLATEASYYLARTDHGKGEKLSEEEYLVEALGWLDSLGVRLVNISLGYTDGFDNPSNNHTVDQVNGHETVLTRACQFAAEARGMLLVIAAGNDGDKPWKVISIPADAPGVLTVGATAYQRWQRSAYSSIGPESLPYMKPNVSCFSYNGTSFSTPIITGMAACIWQMDSSLTNFQVKSLIEQSGHLFPYGNNYVGYGVPSCDRVLANMNGNSVKTYIPLKHNKKKIDIDMPDESGHVVVYHKSDSLHVLEEQILPYDNHVLRLKRFPAAIRTTVSTNSVVLEVAWE